MSRKPIAVLLSDVHYSLQTLELADKSTRIAIDKANELQIPLIVCGDLHDSKANLRGECVNAMISTFKLLKSREAWVLRGNHDALNEKSEEHSLNFLKPYAYIVEDPKLLLNLGDGKIFNLIPYMHDVEELKKWLNKIPVTKCPIIMHQGLQGSNSGEYFQDRTALYPEDVAGRRIISGHYHARQDIPLPDGGMWSYVGNPYTLNYGEAKDPVKGFQVLYSDGSLEFIPTDLRSHIVVELKASDLTKPASYTLIGENDLLKVKLSGTKIELATITKQQIAGYLGVTIPFKLELIYESDNVVVTNTTQPVEEIFDTMITSLGVTEVETNRLKNLWKDL